MLDVRADQGYRQLMDLVEESLDPFVFGDPCADFIEEVMRYIDRARLALDLVGEVPGEMGLAVVTAASRLAAAFADFRESGGQDGLVGSQSAPTSVEHAADLGGMIGDTHGPYSSWCASPEWVRINPYQKKPEKQQCEENNSRKKQLPIANKQLHNHLRRFKGGRNLTLRIPAGA